MGPFAVIGALVCLFALAFIVGFGLVFGAWAAMQAGALAFGAFKISTGPLNINVENKTRS
jgi:hypothetical protein